MVWVVLVLEAFLDFGMAAINDDLITRRICRGEEGKTHDVIPMGMADQKVNSALALTAGTLHEFDSKLSDAGDVSSLSCYVRYFFYVLSCQKK